GYEDEDEDGNEDEDEDGYEDAWTLQIDTCVPRARKLKERHPPSTLGLPSTVGTSVLRTPQSPHHGGRQSRPRMLQP
ncbi:MAG TPA: hypothetical protein VFG30_13060, partial [Polyangiales bacterium]|nr:hypothetical protein [Polyangiales bacterium]